MATTLSTQEIRKRLTALSINWKGGKDEKQDAQTFTLRLMECYGLSEHHYQREYKVKKPDGSTGYMDGFIPGKLIIEFKSLGKNLDKANVQAEDYRWGLKPHEQPRYILLCDFATFVLVDLKNDKQHAWTLPELPKHAEKLRFLIEEAAPQIVEEREADRKAAYQIAQLHQGLLEANFTGKPLEIFLTRILFCLFADDTGMFNQNGQLLQFLYKSSEDGNDLGLMLSMLFQTFNKPSGKRQKTLDDLYSSFPYINGKLFAETAEMPAFDSELRTRLIACAELDWKDISPAIFGAMFQGVMEEDRAEGESRKAKRRDLGAHYTSERNILRAINPLFMNSLREEFKSAGKDAKKLHALLDKLHTLHIFDPACGCGNFLVIAYRELRQLELSVIEALHGKKDKRQTSLLDLKDYAKVSPDQLHGIEIEESAAHIARVAILITDHQINEASRHIGLPRPTIPLDKMPNIVCANALTTDWETVLEPKQCRYIVGNPPFVGAKNMSGTQRADAATVLSPIKNSGLLDYVACWHVKATAYMQKNKCIKTALVSTNSICQGEQVGVLWQYLLKQGVHLHFAHRTFQWSNEGIGVAAVHCIIVGFGLETPETYTLFDYSDNIKGDGHITTVTRINPYLVDGPDALLERRSKPLCNIPKMVSGNKPIDNGEYLFTPEQKATFLEQEPAAAPYFRRWLGAEEFLNGIERWCLWLGNVPVAKLETLPLCKERVDAVREFRAASKSLPTQKLAETPRRFHTEFMAKGSYIALPQVSSERRFFIPIAYLGNDVMCGDKLRLIEDASLYHFGVLNSTLHMAWTRTVTGRLESRYQYSVHIVYNNFPWPIKPTAKQIKSVETAAQAVLDARSAEIKLDSGTTLAMLYNPDTIPDELVKAHRALDKAVDAAYGYKGGKEDASRVSFLFDLYAKLTAPGFSETEEASTVN